MLTNASYIVDYVGTSTANPSPDLPEINHEGHGGWRISDPSLGLYENIFGWFETIEDPHAVLLHIGTNDSGGGTRFTNAVDRLDALITRIALCQPSAHIIVTTLMKRGEPNYTAITNWFNPFVPTKVAAQQALGRRVHFLDMHAYLELSDMADNLHPNAVGYQKMANAWFPAITNIIGTSPAPNQPAPIRALGTVANRGAATITFNKPLSLDSATNTANYAIDQGLTVTSATLDANLRTVTLATSQQAPQTTYTVTLNNSGPNRARRTDNPGQQPSDFHLARAPRPAQCVRSLQPDADRCRVQQTDVLQQCHQHRSLHAQWRPHAPLSHNQWRSSDRHPSHLETDGRRVLHRHRQRHRRREHADAVHDPGQQPSHVHRIQATHAPRLLELRALIRRLRAGLQARSRHPTELQFHRPLCIRLQRGCRQF